MVAKSVATANNMLTDGLNGSPITCRSPRSSQPCGNSATLPISWCALTALGGYLWAKKTK
ncbi:hypothetical protein [Streptomyces exfoliatus]|uniref:hypothetical protein n=1 Tax=Streptomyces exfoliatus TaxID=1905 RepID=UPI000A5F11AC|nr:hypothetical protein [Streptomyces exfoliatus]